jgi:ATP/ADP translocase/HEAT repeat protein
MPAGAPRRSKSRMEKSLSLINRLFNLRPGDFARGMPLFAYYFLIVTFYMIARVARDAIFLDHFTKEQLPYADMSVALLSAIVIAPYIRAGYRFTLRNLQIGSLLFFAANLVAFWWGLHFYESAWLAPVLYVWVGVCGILSIAQVWTLANFVCTTREAKRVFALLGSGGIIGGSTGGFLAKWIAERLGTDATLLFMAAFLILCTLLIRVIWNQRPAPAEEEAASETQERPRNLIESFRLVMQSPHLLAIAALICLGSVVTTMGGWQLKAFAKDTLGHKDAVAAYLGAVAGYTGLLSLVAQLLITTKLLRRFGVGVGLLVLPLSLVAGSAAIIVWGSLRAAAFLRGSDGVFRYSIDTSALQLLYLPVPANIKVQVKSFIDTVIWKCGDGLAALTLLLFATTLRFSPREVSFVNLVLLLGWIAAALMARRQYVATLRSNIRQIRIHPDEESIPVLDQSTANVFAEKLNSNDVNEVMYALNLFDMSTKLEVQSAVRNLLEHPSPHVRKRAISILNKAGDETVRHRVTGLLRDNSLDVRTEALLYLSRYEKVDPLTYIEKLGDFADFSIRSAVSSFFMQPGESYNPEVAAMIIDGMVADLENPETASDAARTLALMEDMAVPALSKQLENPNASLELRRKIPGVLLEIGTPAAGAALAENLVQADAQLRSNTITSLNKLCAFRSDLVVDKQLIETAMVAEMMGHYRSYQILGAGNGNTDETLKRSMAEEVERIFRLMKLMYPSLDLQNAYLGIQSDDAVMHANALEFLDNTLSPQLRTRLVPLVDSEVTLEERVKLANRLLGFTVGA